MTSKWQSVPLSTVAVIRPAKKEVQARLAPDDAVTFMPMEDLPVKGGAVSGVKSKPLRDVYSSYTYFADNDVLLAKITPCFENGKIGVATNLQNGVGFGSSEFMVIRCGSQVDPNFLYYFLSQDSIVDAGSLVMTGSVGHRRVPQVFIENLAIPLPPLDEQKRIVAKLDEAMVALSDLEEGCKSEIEAVETVLSRVMNSTLSNEKLTTRKVSLAEVSSIESSMVDPETEMHRNQMHIGAGNILADSKGLVGVMTAAEEGLRSSKFEFTTKDVLYSKIRPYLRKVWLPDFDGLCSADMYPLRPSENLLSREFLFWLLLTDDFTDYAIAGSARTGMPKVNRDHLFAYEFLLPDLARQMEIVSRINDIANDSESYTRNRMTKLGHISDVKTGILAAAFAGEL